MSQKNLDARGLAEENLALRSRVSELERMLARFGDEDTRPTGASLAEREALLSEAERIAHMGSWVWDPKTGGTVWSDEMARIYGYEPGAIEPSLDAYYTGIHPEDLAAVQAAGARGLETGVSEQIQCRILRPDGEVRHVTMSSVLLFDESGDLRRAVGTTLDTTERDILEEQLRHAQKLEAIGLLAGGVAHDFNNLLTIILGNAECLGFRYQAREIEDIVTASEAAARLTQQLLAFGRRAVLERRPLDINEAIRSSEGLIEKSVGPQVRIDYDLAQDLAPARLDAGQVQQILINLAINARDAMPEGGELHIRTRNTIKAGDDGDHDAVALSVSDDGCGIDSDTIAKIFDPFFTTKPPGAGTGLGLSMVFGAVQQSAGSISVQSTPGQGTAFHLVFPRDTEPADSSVESAAPPFDSSQVSRGALLVESDPDVRRAIAARLRIHGVEVVEAVSGTDALAVLRQRPFDVLLTNRHLPDMQGGQFPLRARELREELPICLMLAMAPQTTTGSGLTGRWTVLQKPVRGRDLMAAVARLLERPTVAPSS